MANLSDLRQRQHDAENMQPWRCERCGVAVRPGFNDPCDCTRADEAAEDQEAWAGMIESRTDREIGHE